MGEGGSRSHCVTPSYDCVSIFAAEACLHVSVRKLSLQSLWRASAPQNAAPAILRGLLRASAGLSLLHASLHGLRYHEPNYRCCLRLVRQSCERARWQDGMRDQLGKWGQTPVRITMQEFQRYCQLSSVTIKGNSTPLLSQAVSVLARLVVA